MPFDRAHDKAGIRSVELRGEERVALNGHVVKQAKLPRLTHKRRDSGVGAASAAV